MSTDGPTTAYVVSFSKSECNLLACQLVCKVFPHHLESGVSGLFATNYFTLSYIACCFNVEISKPTVLLHTLVWIVITSGISKFFLCFTSLIPRIHQIILFNPDSLKIYIDRNNGAIHVCLCWWSRIGIPSRLVYSSRA